MPSLTVVENNFTKGLITEATGLNFPENAATAAENCVFTLVGDVTRRGGFDFEANFTNNVITTAENAINTYKWNNAGGDGLTQVVVTQVGSQLNFYQSSSATSVNPLSKQLLTGTVNLTQYVVQGGTFDATQECQFADGNGYLFVFHPSIDPIYVQLNANIVTATSITVNIRDFTGINETNIPVTTRPLNLSTTHHYNLINQGWGTAPTWNFTSSTFISIQNGGNAVFKDAPAGLSTVVIGTPAVIQGGIAFLQTGNPSVLTATFTIFGTVTAYSGNILQVTVASFTTGGVPFTSGSIVAETWYVQQGASIDYTNTWFNQIGDYPSNADVWWRFKNTSNVFAPSTTISNVTLSTPAPKGSVIFAAFNQQPAAVTGIIGLGQTSTLSRPTTGAWFQGRLWMSGVNSSVNNAGASGTGFYTWTENIYFSQIGVSDPTVFGKCYQLNDPTSEDLFNLLPTDGGVIQIPGSGAIYKLFPIQNGLLVFAANGVWFITGSTGIGFSADDYTIVKLSEIKSISGTSYVNVLGLPYFWNEEGIYKVMPQGQGGGLTVEAITVGTILTFYNNIPYTSRKYARGSYNPIDYLIQWVYRSTQETDITSRYQFDSMLTYNNFNHAFYPYQLIGNTPKITSILYVSSPGGSTAPTPTFKYLTQAGNNYTFSEERDVTNWVDFISFDGVGVNFISTFATGYRVHGQGQRRFQIPYVYVFSRGGGEAGYTIQGIWDYATSNSSGRISTRQVTTIINPNYGMIFRRHRIRGRGITLQLQFTSVTGLPFDIMGWSAAETANTSV